jgi:hypothetical protein
MNAFVHQGVTSGTANGNTVRGTDNRAEVYYQIIPVLQVASETV